MTETPPDGAETVPARGAFVVCVPVRKQGKN